MAKRKRLTPAKPDYFSAGFAAGNPAPETKSMAAPPLAAPIAQVAGDSATRAALDEVSAVLQDARSSGRMIEALDLDAIDAHYLMRDRLETDDEEMSALMDSLRARGQQTPIEVTALPEMGDGSGYGLISGWRRLIALHRLYQEAGEARFATVKALVIAPGSAQDAYLAMVEENEIRVNLSLYERAHIALRAAQKGVFPTARHAVLGLFGATTRSKRSKIGTFVTLVEKLDEVLLHPTAIPEKLGLSLVKALSEDTRLAQKLKDRLKAVNPQSVAEELRILSEAVAPSGLADSKSPPAPVDMAQPPQVPATAPPPLDEVVPGLQVRLDQGRHPRIELTGVRVNDTLYRALKGWLAETQVESER